MLERIVAAVDNDPDRSTRVLDATLELARLAGSEVLVAHVRDLERPVAMMASAGRPGAANPPTIRLETEEEARALVDAAVERLRSAGVQVTGQLGPPAVGSTAPVT